MKTTTARALVVPALALSLAGVVTPAAQALPPRDPITAPGGAGPRPATPPVVAPRPATPRPVTPRSTNPPPMTVSNKTHSTPDDAVTTSGARRMRSTATFFPAERRLVVTTRTWNAVKLTGFTGGAQVVFLDAQGLVIGASSMRTFGVDGMWIGAYSRTDVWEERVDAAWTSRVASIQVLHSHAGKVRLKEIVRYAVETATPIADLVKKLYGLRPSG